MYCRIIVILIVMLTSLISCDNQQIVKSVLDTPKEWVVCADLHFISSQYGFAAVTNRDDRYIIWRTNNGGVTWNKIFQPTDCRLFDCDVDIQCYENIVYIIVSSSATNKSTIYISNNLGETWHKISNLDFCIDDTHIYGQGKIAIVEKNYENNGFTRVTVSEDNGVTWRDILTTSTLKVYYFFVNDSFYYYSDMWIGFPLIKNYKITQVNLDDGSMIDLNGEVRGVSPISCGDIFVTGIGTLRFFNIDNNYITNLSKLKSWGNFFQGGYRSKFMYSHKDELFLVSSQFPGTKELSEAIFYSNDAGSSWNQIELIPNNRERIEKAAYFIENNRLHLVTLSYDNKLNYYSVFK